MNIIRMTGGLGNQMFQYSLYLKFKSMGVDALMEDFTEYVERDNARPIKLSVFLPVIFLLILENKSIYESVYSIYVSLSTTG